MAKKIALGIKPFDLQAKAILSKARITGVVAGARGGKTMTGKWWTLKNAVMQPDYRKEDLWDKMPYTMAVSAPTYPLLEKVVLPAVLGSIPDELKIGPYKANARTQALRGRMGPTLIYFITSNDPTAWLGLRLYRAWIDEFTVIKEEMFNEVQARLSDREGNLFLTGTPRGPNWAKERVYDVWAAGGGTKDGGGNGGGVSGGSGGGAGENGGRGEGQDIGFHTWRTVQNPFFPVAEIRRLKAALPPRYFRRNFEATWDSFEGQVYEEFLEVVHCRPRSNYTFRLPGVGGLRVGNGKRVVDLRTMIAGIDWGYGPGHPGVISVIGRDTHNIWYLLEESVAEGVFKVAAPPADSWLQRARNLMVKWRVAMFYADSADPEAVAQFTKHGIPITPAVKDVLPGIQSVATALHVDEETKEPGFIILSDCRNAVDEFKFYHWKETREEPEKIFDNSMDSVRYAIYTHGTVGAFKRETDRDLAFRRGS